MFLKHVIEEKREGWIKVTGRQGRNDKQLLGYLKEITGYWKLKEEALTRTPSRTRVGRGLGTVVRQTAK